MDWSELKKENPQQLQNDPIIEHPIESPEENLCENEEQTDEKRLNFFNSLLRDVASNNKIFEVF